MRETYDLITDHGIEVFDDTPEAESRWKAMADLDDRYQVQIYLECANEAATKIRNIKQLLCGGTALPEYGSLLSDIYCSVADMIQIFLTTIGIKREDEDDFNDKITRILFAKKDEVCLILKEILDDLYGGSEIIQEDT